MIKRPIPIVLISLFYLLAAVSTLVYTDIQDWFLTIGSAAFYLAMALGLWRLRKWARTAEVVVCYLQILAGAIIVTWLYNTTLLESVPPFDRDWLWIFLTVLCTVNILI
jgi:hypothetical protein